jgi:hypothetical protein
MTKNALRLTDIQNLNAGSSVYSNAAMSHETAAALIKNSIKNGEIDAEYIMSRWFGSVKSDVFISHSGSDRTQVNKLAGYLQAQGYKPFIDSAFWGNIYDLIDTQLNGIKSKNGEVYWSNVKNVCADFYMILSMQLAKMVEKTPYFLFVDTANSRGSKIVGNTNSPWIYLELETAKRVFPHQTQKLFEHNVQDSVSFPTDVDWLTVISASNLSKIFPRKPQ